MSPQLAEPIASDELARIIEAYSAVTQRLQDSHDRLQGEVAQLRRQLATAGARLQRSKRLSALGQMAAGIAHEIRNPLAAIQLYAAMVVEDLEAPGPRPDVALENARKIASAVGRTDYVRVAIEDERVVPIATSGASILSSTVRAAGAVIVPREQEGMPEGAEVEVLLYDEELPA